MKAGHGSAATPAGARPVAVLLTPVLPSPGGSGRALRAWQWLVELSADHQVHVCLAGEGRIEAPEAPACDGTEGLTITESPHIAKRDASAASGPIRKSTEVASVPTGVVADESATIGESANIAALRAAAAAGLPADTLLWRNAGNLAPTPSWLRRLGWLFPLLARWTPRLMTDWLFPRRGLTPFPGLCAALGGRPVARLIVFRLYLHEVGAALRPHLRPASRELDLDDLESTTRLSVAHAMLRLGHPLQALLHASTAWQYRLREHRIAADYHKVWLAAEEDLQRGPPEAAARPHRLPRPSPVAALSTNAASDLELLFIGGLDYPPNTEAARFLATRVAPLLRARLGPAAPPSCDTVTQTSATTWRLTIIGRNADDKLRREMARQGLRFLADVNDLAPYYAQADIVLAPLFAGGGSKFKAIEAFAHRRALIATKEGVRGLSARAGQEYLEAESAEEFAEAIIRLARDEKLRASLAAAAGRLFDEKFELKAGEREDACYCTASTM